MLTTRPPRPPGGRPLVAVLAGLTLLVAGCGSGGSRTTASTPQPAVGGQDIAAPAGAPALRVEVDQAAAAKLPSSLTSAGVLRVAMNTNEPPGHFYGQGTRTMVGIDPDIAGLLAQRLGVRLQIQVVSFDQIIPGLAASRYDIAVAQMSPTSERMKVLDFVNYARVGDALGVPPGNPKKITPTTLCGRTVAALKGSYQVAEVLPGLTKACTDKGQPAISISLFPDQQSASLAVASGRADGVYADSPVVGYAARETKQIEVQQSLNYGPVGVAIPKGSGTLQAIEAAMTSLLTTPQYKESLQRWGVGDAAISKAGINDAG